MNGSMLLTCSVNDNKTTRIYICIVYKIIFVTWNLWFPVTLAPIHPKNLYRRRPPWHHCLPQLRWHYDKVFFIYLLKFIFASNCRTSFTTQSTLLNILLIRIICVFLLFILKKYLTMKYILHDISLPILHESL